MREIADIIDSRERKSANKEMKGFQALLAAPVFSPLARIA